MDKFKYLRTGLSIILVFIGIKMLVVDFIEISVTFSLVIIVIVLTVSILASVFANRRSK